MQHISGLRWSTAVRKGRTSNRFVEQIDRKEETVDAKTPSTHLSQATLHLLSDLSNTTDQCQPTYTHIDRSVRQGTKELTRVWLLWARTKFFNFVYSSCCQACCGLTEPTQKL